MRHRKALNSDMKNEKDIIPHTLPVTPVVANARRIEQMILLIRNQQVMLDSDLADLYNVQTRTLNQAVKRNIARFPESFCFQLNHDETENLRSQIVISNPGPDDRGGRRYLPYAFTQQGIAMLSSVLKSETAIQVSINIMNAFVAMHKLLVNHALLFERISKVELKQLAFQESTDRRFGEVFGYLGGVKNVAQKIFFEGQIFDAFSLITSLITKAENEIILIDNYVDITTLNALSKKRKGIKVTVYTSQRTKLTDIDIDTFNRQYAPLKIIHTDAFHDRFMILDQKVAYHIGASIKDAGKKSFAISPLEGKNLIDAIMERLPKQ